MLNFVDALHDPRHDPRPEREALVAAIGAEAAERAAGVAATFQMMNRLLDGVGAPVKTKRHFRSVAEAMGFQLDALTR